VAELAALQRQFYDRVVSGADGDALIASGSLEVYASMYAIRLHDALADDYPKLRSALGAEAFAALVPAYLREHPPHAFTLRELGAALPGWLRTAASPPWAADLATLERARMEVFDAADAPALTQAEAIALGDALPELHLRWVPASVVVPLAWAVDDLWSALEDEQDCFEPAAGPRVVLVWRRDLAVLHRTLDADEAPLAPLIAGGARFAEICEQLAAQHGEAAGARAAELLLRWLAAGALAAP